MSVLHRTMNGAVAILASVAIAACGGGDGGGSATGGGDTGGGDTGGGAAMTVTDPATISGMIEFTGMAPEMAVIDMSAEPTCAEKHSTPPTEESVIASNGHLANVFVYISDGISGNYASPPAPTIDQDGCEYIPHITGVVVGQELAFQNSDGLLHNIKTSPTANPPFNISQPTTMTTRRTFNTPEVMIPVQCDVHGWMHAYIGVVAHPFFAVSGMDGSFNISGLPAGTYTLTAWHEQYGTMTQQITVAANETAQVTFTYDAAAQANAVVPLGDPIDPHDHGTPVGAHADATTR